MSDAPCRADFVGAAATKSPCAEGIGASGCISSGKNVMHPDWRQRLHIIDVVMTRLPAGYFNEKRRGPGDGCKNIHRCNYAPVTHVFPPMVANHLKIAPDSCSLF